ncbi:hypothetical protein [Longimicrobium sp.]|uniref:hypothetical protein n=1 Tax=Longimicrobium sp. TaxID=2029185 RepID=UPI002E2EADDF|nr:hypothetical protein [Longimicrobium sp.]HEX6038053.1 hypothetical protein [Longimicrobium sp.]
MKKIQLRVDDLEVRSFDTGAATELRGTIHGNAYTYDGSYSCNRICRQQTFEFDTCYETGPTCGATCDWPCASGAPC